MKLKNLHNEIEAKNHEGAKVIVTKHRKSSKRAGGKDFLDMFILNVSIAIGVFMLVIGVNMLVGGYFAKIPSMLGLG